MRSGRRPVAGKPADQREADGRADVARTAGGAAKTRRLAFVGVSLAIAAAGNFSSDAAVLPSKRQGDGAAPEFPSIVAARVHPIPSGRNPDFRWNDLPAAVSVIHPGPDGAVWTIPERGGLDDDTAPGDLRRLAGPASFWRQVPGGRHPIPGGDPRRRPPSPVPAG